MLWKKGNVENGSLSKQCTGKRETWKTEVCQNNAWGKGICGKQKSVKMHWEKENICQINILRNGKTWNQRFVQAITWHTDEIYRLTEEPLYNKAAGRVQTAPFHKTLYEKNKTYTGDCDGEVNVCTMHWNPTKPKQLGTIHCFCLAELCAEKSKNMRNKCSGDK